MTTERRVDNPHAPVWRVSDEAWERVYPILLEDCPPRKGPGRKPADWRRVLNGIIYRLRTGCHWNKLPKEFGDDSTIHRWYQRWNKNGVMSRVLSELRGEWQEGGEWHDPSANGNATSRAAMNGHGSGHNESSHNESSIPE
ncbi:MAG TPA: transposase [Pirellulales bacterium]|jgi:putative transposase|nr:transposase [Pirellulales bacterium]